MPACVRFHIRQTSKPTEEGNFLSCSYEIDCNGKREAAGWDPSDATAVRQMAEVLERFAAGGLQRSDLQWLAPKLREFVRWGPILENLVGTEQRRCSCVEFSSDPNAASALTNMPWEMTALRADGLSEDPQALLKQVLGSVPVTRIVPCTEKVGIPDARLRALYCVSNPRVTGLFSFDAEAFQAALKLVFQQFPVLDVRASCVIPDMPCKAVVLSEIRNFRPHVFVFVGHGDSGDRGVSTPAILFEHWMNISELMDCLVSTERAFLAALVCCDLTRQNGAQSGAYALASGGVPSVLAMQGSIDAQFAKVYLENFLSSLLVSCSLPLAASSGRIVSARSSSTAMQAFLPALFSTEHGSSDLFRKTIAGFRTEAEVLGKRVPVPSCYLARPTLEEGLRKALENGGLVGVTGGPGCGKTTLLERVIHARLVDSSAVPARPIFYLSCDSQEFADRSFAQVARRTINLLNKHAILLPEERELDGTSPEEFCVGLDKKRMILVLDNLSMGSGSSSPGWKVFFAAARAMTKSLLVVAENAPDSEMWKDVSTIPVTPFTSDETECYVRKFIAEHARKWKQIDEDTGGLPLLLDGVRILAKERGRLELSWRSPKDKALGSTGRYVKKIVQLLLTSEVQTLCNFCWLPAPTSRELADKFLDATRNHRGVRALKRVGVLRTALVDGVEDCDIPGAIAGAVRGVCADRVKRAANLLTRELEENLPKAEQAVRQYFKQTAERPGGLALLTAMQHAYIAQGNLLRAGAIPVLASEGGVANEARWEMYETVLPQLKKARDFPFLLSAAEAAHAIGKQNEALEILGSIPAGRLTPYYRVQFLKLKATILKDVEQHAAIEKLRAIYSEAIPLCEKGLAGEITDKDASEETWKNLLVDLLQNRLNALAFLEGQASESFLGDLERLKSIEGDSPSFAYALCLVAERELKLNEATVNWNRVAENILAAKQLLKLTQDDRILLQAEFLYGEYLERKPDRVLKEAAKAYRRSEQAAERAGEARRVGRARRKWVDLEWRTLGTLKAEKACELLEDLIPGLKPQARDALSMRVLERIYTLRAEIGKTLPQDPTERFLLEACRTAAKPMLLAKSDKERLRNALVTYLDAMKAQENFVGAQEFVTEFKQVLKERLGVEPLFDNPWAVRNALRANNAKEGG